MHITEFPHHVATRRGFLKSAAGIALASGLPLAIRATASANDRIAIGCIGVGSRGTDLMNQIMGLAETHNVQITAICDVWEKNLETAAGRVKEKFGAAPGRFTRFQDLLASQDLDAVTIATPDFTHGTILTAALEAGKDVYIEKPMTIDLASANKALDLARAKSRIVQAGTQRRSEGRFLAAARQFAGGLLGKVSRVSAAMYFHEPRWVRDLADCQAADVDWDAFLLHLEKRPFEARLLRQWQLYRETSNGLPGLWMTHYADAVHFITGASYPASAVAHGGVYVWKDGRETSDTFHALLEYPEGFLFDWGMGLGNSSGVHFTIHGTQGTMDLEKWMVSPAGGRDTTLEAGPIPTDPDQSHMGNWLDCLRSRGRPNADIMCGHQHAVATIMAAEALRTGRRQTYDRAARTITPA
jgi:predicted dehydrogenase